MKLLGKIQFQVIVLLVLLGCKTECKNEIVIFEGLYFEKGQSYKLEIENGDLVKSETFSKTQIRGQNFNEIDSYCCKVDSCKVKFTLDSKDTVFYISPKKTRRLLIGSDINGNFSIATDENRNAWIRM